MAHNRPNLLLMIDLGRQKIVQIGHSLSLRQPKPIAILAAGRCPRFRSFPSHQVRFRRAGLPGKAPDHERNVVGRPHHLRRGDRRRPVGGRTRNGRRRDQHLDAQDLLDSFWRLTADSAIVLHSAALSSELEGGDIDVTALLNLGSDG